MKHLHDKTIGLYYVHDDYINEENLLYMFSKTVAEIVDELILDGIIPYSLDLFYKSFFIYGGDYLEAQNWNGRVKIVRYYNQFGFSSNSTTFGSSNATSINYGDFVAPYKFRSSSSFVWIILRSDDGHVITDTNQDIYHPFFASKLHSITPNYDDNDNVVATKGYLKSSNIINSDQIIDNSIETDHLTNGCVTNNKLANNIVLSAGASAFINDYISASDSSIATIKHIKDNLNGIVVFFCSSKKTWFSNTFSNVTINSGSLSNYSMSFKT